MRVWELFWHFALISLLAYGGGSGIPLIERTAVREQGWITEDELAAAISLGQVTPGPVMIAATFIGERTAGLGGALAATVGVFLIPFISAGALASRLTAATPPRWVGGFRKGAAAAGLGLLGVTVLELARHSLHGWGISVIAVASLILTAGTRVHPFWILLGGASLGMLAATF